MVKLVCKECDYRFEADTIKKECPYCGKHEVVEEPSAQDLVGI